MTRMQTTKTKPSHAPRREQPLVVIATRSTQFETEPLDDELVNVLLEEAGKRGWRLLHLNLTGGSLSGEGTPAGALVTLLPIDPMAQRLRALGCPVVRLGRLEHPDDAAMPAVIPDLVEAGRMAADYFARRGFAELALIGHTGMQQKDWIEKGFSERADALGCAVHGLDFENIDLHQPTLDEVAGRYDTRQRKLASWLATLPKPIGLLACGDAIAGMVNTMCRRAELAVPEDVAVLSVGNKAASCELGPVPISAIELSWTDRGRAAMRVLDELMQGNAVPTRTFVPPRAVVTRRSTDILAVDDPIVARAIRFIWDHLDVDLAVADVAEAMQTPRYKLERLFRKYFDRGVNAELRRVRLERFRELLRTTDQTVDQLAPQVGYKSPKRLHVAFRDKFGLTPRKYRLQARQVDSEAAAQP